MKHQTYLYVQTNNVNYERKMIMKKMLRKSTAILSSAIIASVLAVPSMTAFAADDDTWANLYNSTNTITLKKQIVITTETDYETTGASVDVPDIIYTYEVAPVTFESDAPTITDRDGYTVNVSSGVAGGLIIGKDATAAFGNGTEDKKTINITGDSGIVTDTFEITLVPENFTTAGIYRYKITETTDPETVASAGILRPEGYSDTRYVDVYVRMNNEDKAEIYGTVVFAEGGDVDAEITQKTEGFTDESDVTDPKDEEGEDCKPYEGKTAASGLADTYPLMNYTVKKVVVGNTGKFDFTVTVTDENNYFIFDGDGTTKTVSKGSAEIKKELGNDGEIVLKNLPATASIAVSEKNRADNNSAYMVTAEDTKGGTLIDNLLMDAGALGSQGFASTAFATIDDDTLIKNLDETTFTNTVKEISVTGVLFTVAPFAALAGVGTLFAGLFIKNRKRDDSNEII